MTYLAAVLIVVGVSLFVAAPLFEAARRRQGRGPNLELARLEHERALAVQALRELEFDHQMRKLSEQDWAELKQRLEARALRAMAAIEKLDREALSRNAPVGRKRPARIAESGQTKASPVRFCPLCGKPVADGVSFCGNCGAAVTVRELSMTR